MMTPLSPNPIVLDIRDKVTEVLAASAATGQEPDAAYDLRVAKAGASTRRPAARLATKTSRRRHGRGGCGEGRLRSARTVVTRRPLGSAVSWLSGSGEDPLHWDHLPSPVRPARCTTLIGGGADSDPARVCEPQPGQRRLLQP
jgi:hypothetical protein